jgi:hypothetical protein
LFLIESCTNLLLQLPLGAFEVLDEQVFAGELLVIWEVVDALPIMQVQLVQLVVDPTAGMLVTCHSMYTVSEEARHEVLQFGLHACLVLVLTLSGMVLGLCTCCSSTVRCASPLACNL